ncbi:DUF1330 domain-containing protein [Paraburkholderia ferrariae]|uniref:DUF1330 domain-containing protein n=1 Tax=Paraburkholderia ferrariae TaxID=386056 RepID=UPI000487991F|nr:DUF1330 domain-containing protein [Paraburkholderia ferrariae]
MACFIVFDIDVHDPAGYEEYRRLGAPTVADYGGRFVVRGGVAENLEGNWSPSRVVVLEFDSAERARAWYASTEYQTAKAVRDRTAHSIGIIVQGI